MKRNILSGLLFLFCICKASSVEFVIEPTGNEDDSNLIQSALDRLQEGDTLRLKGNFIVAYAQEISLKRRK